MFPTGRKGDDAAYENRRGIDSVTAIDDVDAEFRGEEGVAVNFRAGTEDIHQDAGAIGHESREGNDHVVMHEIELESNYEKQDRRSERQI